MSSTLPSMTKIPKMEAPDMEPKVRLANNIEISSKTHFETMLGLEKMYESQMYALCALNLRNTNGSEGYGVDFSAAFCSTEIAQEIFYPFGSIFGNGIRILYNFLKRPETALAKDEMEMCTKLIKFLDSDAASFFTMLANGEFPALKNEACLSVALAEHFLKKLALKEDYKLDRRCMKTDADVTCRCGCGREVKDKFKDTSIGELVYSHLVHCRDHPGKPGKNYFRVVSGHNTVWHGDVDIVAGCGDQEVPVLVSAPEPECPGDSMHLDKKFNLVGTKHQLIAQSIVFSFWQKKRHPCKEHFLIPTIGICPEEVIFYFYDAENDVLLQSSVLPLYRKTDDGSISVAFGTIIAVWLVLNYKYLGTGLTGELKLIPKSNFCNLSSGMLDLYKNQLSFGDVGYSTGTEAFHYERVMWTNFRFPADVEKVNLND